MRDKSGVALNQIAPPNPSIPHIGLIRPLLHWISFRKAFCLLALVAILRRLTLHRSPTKKRSQEQRLIGEGLGKTPVEKRSVPETKQTLPGPAHACQAKVSFGPLVANPHRKLHSTLSIQNLAFRIEKGVPGTGKEYGACGHPVEENGPFLRRDAGKTRTKR